MVHISTQAPSTLLKAIKICIIIIIIDCIDCCLVLLSLYLLIINHQSLKYLQKLLYCMDSEKYSKIVIFFILRVFNALFQIA